MTGVILVRMNCPNCSTEVYSDATECPSCQVIFAKFNAQAERLSEPTELQPPPPPSMLSKMLSMVVGIGLLVFAWQWTKQKTVERQARAAKEAAAAPGKITQAAERLSQAPQKAQAAVTQLNAAQKIKQASAEDMLNSAGQGQSVKLDAQIDDQLKAAQQFQ
jgi:hypothetical protein